MTKCFNLPEEVRMCEKSFVLLAWCCMCQICVNYRTRFIFALASHCNAALIAPSRLFQRQSELKMLYILLFQISVLHVLLKLLKRFIFVIFTFVIFISRLIVSIYLLLDMLRLLHWRSYFCPSTRHDCFIFDWSHQKPVWWGPDQTRLSFELFALRRHIDDLVSDITLFEAQFVNQSMTYMIHTL
jgi:hypothetical protein